MNSSNEFNVFKLIHTPYQELINFQLEPGWYDHEDLEKVRAWLFPKGYVAKVNINNKTEIRKIACILPSGRLVVIKTPDRLAEIAALGLHFGEPYHMTGLPAMVGNCIHKGLRSKRENALMSSE